LEIRWPYVIFNLLNFDHLELFREIVQTKSLTRGAAQCGVSQSAASQHLQELEAKLGVTLLDRSRRPFILTPAGKLYYEMCRDILRRKEEFEVALEQAKADVEGTVRVASIYSVGLSEMSYLKAEFSRRHPDARLQVEYLRPEKVYDAVMQDRADLGLVSYPESTRELAVIPWRQEQMVVAAAPGHPLAQQEALRPEDLDGLDFIGFDDDLPIRREIDRFLYQHGVEVALAMHFDNVEMVKEAVALGVAVSILPARVIRADVMAGRLAAIPIEAELVRPLGIVHRRRKKFHRAAQSFLDLLLEQPASQFQPA